MDALQCAAAASDNLPLVGLPQIALWITVGAAIRLLPPLFSARTWYPHGSEDQKAR